MATSNRRQALAALAAVGLGAGPGHAADAPHYAVVSLLGDELEIVYGAPGVGRALDRNVRKALPGADAAFDKIAMLEVQSVLQRLNRDAGVTLLGLPPSRLHREPERLFDGDSIVLPGTVVDSLNQAKATHVLLLTKRRAETNVAVVGGTIGYGTLRGLGYYVDNVTSIVLRDTGQRATGLLAVFVYMQLTLADARTGRIVAQRTVASTRAQPVAAALAADPFDALTPDQKFEGLRALLQTEIINEVPKLVAQVR